MIEFVRIWAFLFLPLPLVAWYFLPPKPSQKVLLIPQSVGISLGTVANSGITKNRTGRQNFWPHAIGWVALIVALGGPQTKGEELVVPTGRDIVLAIDFSASMGAMDMPSKNGSTDRITITRELVGEFANQLSGDRVALVAFASEAFVIAPLTYDSEAVGQMMEELTIGLPGRKTDLGRAIGITVKLFQNVPKSDRLLIIVSDGETNAGGLSALDAAKLAKEQGIAIHMIGFAENIVANSERNMRKIATLTGGEYHLAPTPGDLQQSLAHIQEAALQDGLTKKQFTTQDWSWLFLLLALVSAAYVLWREVRDG